MFDMVGNFLYCSSCIQQALCVSNGRITHQRRIKQQQSKQPIIPMEKNAVEAQSLVMPSGVDLSFKKWWGTLSSTALVDVRYPHERHGNAGKQSNSAKADIKGDFLEYQVKADNSESVEASVSFYS